mmetsp:Transcript_26581/g.87136  ORF Transcript_26581/g.87136 Transcript_26581/m.87136 type:complete len:327 (-) Transcript_26581:284-1264(-)
MPGDDGLSVRAPFERLLNPVLCLQNLVKVGVVEGCVHCARRLLVASVRLVQEREVVVYLPLEPPGDEPRRRLEIALRLFVLHLPRVHERAPEIRHPLRRKLAHLLIQLLERLFRHVCNRVVVVQNLHRLVQLGMVRANHRLCLLQIQRKHFFPHGGSLVVPVVKGDFRDEAYDGIMDRAVQPKVPVLEAPRDCRVVAADFHHNLAVDEHGGVELVPVRNADDAEPLREAPVVRHRVKIAHAARDDVHVGILPNKIRRAVQIVAAEQVVRVKHAQPAPSGVPEPDVAGVSQAPVVLVHDAHPRVRVLLEHQIRHLPRIIGRPVIDDD